MGMFDKQPNFGETFRIGDRFVLHGARYDGPIKTVHGSAEKSTFIIATREEPDTMTEYSALGVGFARQAKAAEASDFPVVVEYVSVATGNEGNSVKLLAPVPMDTKDFVAGDNGPPADMESVGGGDD
jgi:hypothetical protein